MLIKPEKDIEAVNANKPIDSPLLPHILESVDREIAFYRHRAGQVFFFGLTAEVLIIIGQGQYQLQLPGTEKWMTPALSTIFYSAVAIIGIILGSEYRRRIRYNKRIRDDLLGGIGGKPFFMPLGEEYVSEILVLYFILGFLSTIGIAVSWLKPYPQSICLEISIIAIGGLSLVGGICVYAINRRKIQKEMQNRLTKAST